jgi:hypothetical protein
MKGIGCSLLLAVVACAGCVNAPFGWPGAKSAPAPVPARAKGPPPPVSADDVTPANAHEKAQVLHEELERAASDRNEK